MGQRMDLAWRCCFHALSAVGIADLLQERQALRRNYPVVAHFRYFLESFGPEIRQYFIESDADERPFSRQQRAIVYQRSKNTLDKRPFGTLLDVYADKYEWINHSLMPTDVASHDFRITIGVGRAQPYSASVFNISAMSFGALSANAIRALNEGARRGNFFQDTGEGSISQYHRENGGDLVWEIGSGYFGCRDDNGRFSAEKFVANACTDQVRMIEVKLSQGAKPGHGGVLPGVKVSPEIAAARGVPVGEDCVSPARHSAFSTPVELLRFVNRLRELSGGKPTGFKLAIGHPWEWFAIAKAMRETGVLPDFIVVDGGEGGTGAAPMEFTDHVGVPLREALVPGAQHPGRTQLAPAHPHRRGGQDNHRLRYRAHVGAGRGLVQRGAWLHVLPGLHPVPELPYRPLPDRRDNPEPGSPEGAGACGQGDARASVPREHHDGAARPDRRRRAQPPR